MTSPLSLTGMPLELLVVVPLAIAVIAAVRAPVLRPGLNLAVASLTPILALGAALSRPAGTALYRPLVAIARVGSVDVSLALVLDASAALAAVAIGLAVVVLAARRRDPATFARLHAIEAAAMLAVLADNLPLALLGWLGVAAFAAPRLSGGASAAPAAAAVAPGGGSSGGSLAPTEGAGGSVEPVPASSRSFAWARVGDAAWLIAMVLWLWALGGTWTGGGYTPDLRPRFAPSNATDDASARLSPPLDLRLAQRAEPPRPPEGIEGIEPPRHPGVIEPPERPRPPRRRDATPEPPSLQAKTGYLTMTTHPGARIYLGVATADELRANQGLPRCEAGTIRPDCVTIAPFVRTPIRAGVHRVAIMPGGGAIVGGDGVEAAAFTLRVAPDEEVHLEAIGPTLRFSELGREIARLSTDRVAARTLFGLSPLWLAALMAVVGLAAMAGMAPFFWLADASEDEAAPLTLAVAPLIAAHLATRLAGALTPALEVLGWIGAISALVGALIAARQRDPRRTIGWIVAAVAASLLAGAEATWAVVVGLAVQAVCLCGWWAALEAACGEIPRDLRALPRIVRRPAKIGALAAVVLAASPPLAGFFARDAALAALTQGAGWIAWALALAAALAAAFAVARLQIRVLAARASKRKPRTEVAVVAGTVLVVVGAAVVLGTVALFSPRPLGGGGEPLAAAWLGGALGQRGGGRLVLAALLAGVVVVGALAARRTGEERRVPWLEGELRLPRAMARGGALVAGLAGWVVRAERGLDAPLEGIGRRLGAALSRVAGTRGGRIALAVVTVVLVAAAMGAVAR